ncbi:Late embryogenesis abundant (LEA) hydroxyproline-rich glycoprotein family [Raphanus sativus]|nr:Late embryogenesis abundant (LEA) hydroxyproline-rich glycoprotein family [Raphanus sativus]
MTDDRVYPASKPPGASTANPTFPANKAQLYNANRPAYPELHRLFPQSLLPQLHLRQPPHHRHLLSVIAKNPNKNVGFDYDATDITVFKTSPGDDDVVIGKGSIPSFFHGKKNTTLLKSTIGSPPGDLDELSAGKLKGELKAKKAVAIKIVLDTKVKVKMGSVKSPKSGIRVTCEGIKAAAPTGKKATTAATSAAKCKVDLRIKIWKFTF